MLRLRDGDDLALSTLMERWKQPLISFLCRYTGNRETALDLAQETFIRIYTKRSSYRVKGKFSTWLFTIAANLSRNHARWNKRHPFASLRHDIGNGDEVDETHLIADESDTPDEISAKGDRARKIRAAVDELPHGLRTAILLFEFEDLSYSDIAAVLGCSEKAVETRLYRARKRLRERLAALIKEES